MNLLNFFPEVDQMKLIQTQTHFSGSDFIKITLICISLAIIYYPVALALVQVWIENDNYSHGFFIPIISGYMIYSMRNELRLNSFKPCNFGIIILLFGLLQLLIGKIGSEFFVQRTSLLLVFIGITLFLFGTFHAKKILLPILYLIFMVPLPAIIWNRLAFPMQLFATKITENTISFFGIPVLREGNILYLAETTLDVVGACSGLRSLLAMFALSAAFSWFAPLTTLKKLVLFLSAAPIAILANIVRLTSTALLAHYFGEQIAQGFLHEVSGLIIFLLGFLLVGVVYWLLRRIFVSKDFVNIKTKHLNG